MRGAPWSPGVVRGSLQKQYSVAVASIVGVLLATALLCSGTVVWAAVHISGSMERVLDLQVANREILQEMTDAQSGVQNYILSVEERQSGAPRYEYAISRLYVDQRTLRQLAGRDAELLELVTRQEEADVAWLTDYAVPVVDSDPDTQPAADGDELFRAVTRANAAVSGRIDAIRDDHRSSSRTVLGLALTVVVLLPLILLAGVVVVVRRAGRAVLDPLTHIARVLERLRAGEVSARADVRGPEEIRQIARALNLLTDANLRASEIEADVLYQLESIDRVRTDLVSTVSHELRTPLTSIAGYLELLEDDLAVALQPHQTAMVDAIRRNLDRLNELIDNLLALSRAEETQLSVEPVDLRAVAAEVAADVRLQAAARDIAVRTPPAAEAVVVLGDRSQLIRAVQNLVTNAVKFSRPGGIVEVRVRRAADLALLEVADEGIGIPVADLEGLGSRFYRASNAMKAEISGTGLGLRIVQTILDRHEGALSVESVEGEGSTFTIRLPLGPREAGPEGGDVPERVSRTAADAESSRASARD